MRLLTSVGKRIFCYDNSIDETYRKKHRTSYISISDVGTNFDYE